MSIKWVQLYTELPSRAISKTTPPREDTEEGGLSCHSLKWGNIQARHDRGLPIFQLGEIFLEVFGKRKSKGKKCILSGQGEKFSHEDSRLSNLLSM